MVDALEHLESPTLESLPPIDERGEVFVVSNPLAGAKSGGDLAAQLADCLQGVGLKPCPLQKLEEVAEATQAAFAAGRLRAVVAVGGDGTASAVVNRISAETPLALLPRGTENLLAKHLQQPFDPQGVCNMIVAGQTARFDVGRAGDKLFLLMLSAGFDADVVHRMAAGRQGHITHWSWAKPIWESLRSYQYPEIRLYWRCLEEQVNDSSQAEEHSRERSPLDSADWQSGDAMNARWAFVSNLPCYARGIPIAPDAHGSDGLLDVCAYNGGSWASGLKLLIHTMLRRHHRLPNCRLFRAGRLRLESDAPVPYQVDGDPGGFLPVDIEIVPRRMKLIVPKSFEM